uniref:Uncharacterized protein n=1 Tax=Kalanchoe fedtschenkoi TaxID=63787 RepID=A0A7N0SV91_KALFE
MLRQSSSRNQRSKSVRGKHILQVCMLLAVCFWLIYQVKHSHDKRKHFEESDSELPEKLPKFEEGLKLGRKDLHPRDEEQSTNHEKIDEEEVEDEEASTLDETKNETQEELERKRKEEGSADIEALLEGTVRGEEEETGGGGGDDEIDEQDHDKGEGDGEANEDENIVEEDKVVEKDEENENEENNEEEHQLEDGQDHDRNGRNTHEAREEHYKGDDASSAVVHATQNTLNGELDVQEHGDSLNETEVGKERSLNATNLVEKGDEVTSPELEDVPNKIDTNEASSETVDSTLQHGAGQVLEMTPDVTNSPRGLSDDKSSNITVVQNFTLSGINRTEYNPTTSDSNMEQDEITNSTMNRDFSAADLVGGSNQTTSSNLKESQTTDENEDLIEYKADSEGDSILSSLNDDETLRDPLISEVEDKRRESLIDLDTLPEIRTEGTDSDDAAAE